MQLKAIFVRDAGGCGRAAARPFMAAACLLVTSSSAFAHEGHIDHSRILSTWTFEPWVVAPMAIVFAMYAFGVVRLWRNAGWNHGIRVWQAAAFVSGWLTLVVALISPLDALSGVLFSAHMAQHELLMVIAAPLMVLGRPFIAALWSMPSGWRRTVGTAIQSDAPITAWHLVSGPFVATVLHGLALWIWHLPSLYEATLRSELVHSIQHLSFFLTAALFWWALIHGRYGRIGYGMAVVYVFVTTAHTGALGALLTFAPNVLYPIYESTTRAWGLVPVEDQQLAGLIMWVPAGLVTVILGLALFAAWLGEAERRVALAESAVPQKVRENSK